MNNPSRYTDPTGHYAVDGQGSKRGCSDSRYCENGKPRPRDEGKKTDCKGLECIHNSIDDDDIALPTEVFPEDSPKCQNAVLAGGLIIASMLPIEFALGYGMVLVAPTVLANPLLGLTLEIVLLLPEAVAVNTTLVGAQYVAQGKTHSYGDINIDPLPLVHLFFPNLMK